MSTKDQNDIPVKCPYCKKDVDIEASVCPYCQHYIGLINLSKREPQAFSSGVLFAFIGVGLSFVIHTDFIIGGFKAFYEDPGCCLCLTVPMACAASFLIFLYAVGGFFLGFLIVKALPFISSFKNK
jgi:hypothetical protein